jgi:hypothetical protein
MKNKSKRVLGMLAGIVSILGVTVVLNSQAAASCTLVSKLSDLAAFSKTLPLTPKAPLAAPIAAAAVTDENNDGGYPSIVGMWHVHYYGPFPGGVQEAFQIFNAGGTEAHNPNVDPRSGSICFGAWAQTGRNSYKLTHRVWLYDTAGNFQGVGDLEVNINVTDKGAKQSGTLTFQIFDLDGIPVSPVFGGTLSGERITPN